MNSKAITLSNGDKVTMYSELTRGLEKKIRVRSFQNTKLVRNSAGEYVVESLDIPEADKIADFKVVAMTEKIEKADGTTVTPSVEYLDGLLAKDFEMLSAHVVEVLKAANTAQTEEVKKG